MTTIEPLFYSLKSLEDSSVDLTPNMKEELLAKIKTLDLKGSELLFALIKFYEVKFMTSTRNEDIPFDGKYISREYRFDLEKFPLPLRHIIYRFVLMHVKNMEEESVMSSEREKLKSF